MSRRERRLHERHIISSDSSEEEDFAEEDPGHPPVECISHSSTRERIRRSYEEYYRREASAKPISQRNRILNFDEYHISIGNPKDNFEQAHVVVNWERTCAIQATECGSGSSGVFFFLVPPESESDDEGRDVSDPPEKIGDACDPAVPQEKVVVVKGSSYVAEEIFGSLFGRYMGIDVPSAKLLESLPADKRNQDPDGKSEVWRVRQAVKRLAPSNVRIVGKAERNLARPFLLQMNFVDGVALQEFAQCPSSAQLFEFGRIFVFDLIINNYDRFPCPVIWDHQGNRGNLMIRRTRANEFPEIGPALEVEAPQDDGFYVPPSSRCIGGAVVAIDSCANPLPGEEFVGGRGVDWYLLEVEAVVRTHCEVGFWTQPPRAEESQEVEVIVNPYLARIKEYVWRTTLHLVFLDDLVAFWDGMDAMFRLILSKREGEIQRSIFDLTAKAIGMRKGEDWMGVFAQSAVRIDAHFFASVADVIRRTYLECRSLIPEEFREISSSDD